MEEVRLVPLASCYRLHHERVAGAVDAELKREGKAAIMDCHSFPSKPLHPKYQSFDASPILP